VTAAGLSPEQVVAFVLLDLSLVVAAAAAFGALARRLGQPTVVGQIVAGVLLGPTLLGPKLFTWSRPWSLLHCDASLGAATAVTDLEPSITSCLFPPQARSILGAIGQLALILYMFLVGLELDLAMLKGRARAIVSVAVGATLVPAVFGILIGPSLYDGRFVGRFGTPQQPSRLAFGLMVGAMLAVTAFPVMAHILQEKGLHRGAMGSVGLASTALLSVLMFLVLATAVGVAGNQSASRIATKWVAAAGFVALLLGVVRPLLRPLGRAVAHRGSVTNSVFATVFVLLFVSAYAADRLGINVIPGAFLVGAILPERALVLREMSMRLRDLTVVVLLPVFLAYSGLATDFTKLGKTFAAGVALFLVAGVAAKWAGGAAGARLAGMGWPEANVLGVLMNCRGLLVLVVALVALDAGVISAQLQTGAVLMALLTTVMTGPLFDRAVRRLTATPVDR
jgi:Kef-type K+ transport system membrane component KefB